MCESRWSSLPVKCAWAGGVTQNESSVGTGGFRFRHMIALHDPFKFLPNFWLSFDFLPL